MRANMKHGPTKNANDENNIGAASGRPKGKKPGKGKLVRRIVIFVAVIAAVGAAALAFRAIGRQSQDQTLYTEAEVTRRDITVELKGTGMVTPVDSYEVISLVTGQILQAPFEEGDTIEKDSLLYSIDTSDVENTIQRAQLAVEKAQFAYNESLKSLDDLQVRAAADGQIASLNVSEGDSVQTGMAVAVIRDSSHMLLEVYFNASDAHNIGAGQNAQVVLENTFETLSGTVTSVSAMDETGAGGALVRKVEISVDNPGALSPQVYATASVGSVACQSGGYFSYETSRTVTAQTSGTVETIYIDEGGSVSVGQKILVLSNDSLDTQVQNSKYALEDARLSLKNSQQQLDNYSITSPIAGTVIVKNYKTGDKMDATSTNKVMAVIYDMSSLELTMDVDELDITKVSLGQTVQITADALPDKTYSGTVSEISIKGASSGGTTSYPVTVVVENPQELIPGMNVTAKVMLEQKRKVLSIPVEALTRDNQVMVMDKDGKGYHNVTVKTGASNNEYVEITSGLSEGDTIVYIPDTGTGTVNFSDFSSLRGEFGG